MALGKYKTSSNKKSNIYRGVAMFLAVLSLAFIFSKSFMYDDMPVLASELNVENDTLTNRLVEVKRWQYDPESELMEVYFTTEKLGKSDITFTAKERNNPSEDIPIEIVAEYDDNYIIQMPIPADYHTVGIVIAENKGSDLQNITRVDFEEVAAEEEQAEEKEEENAITYYGDYREVETAKLGNKSSDELITDALLLEIDQTKERQKKLNEEYVPEQEEVISGLENEIALLKENTEYLTAEEVIDNDQKIESFEAQIETAEANIVELETLDKGYSDKIKKTEERINKRDF